MASASLQNRYRTVKLLPAIGPLRYIVAEPEGGAGRLVLINELSDRAFINRFLGDLYDARHPKPAFPAYEDCFTEDAKVYAVFTYTEGVALIEYLRKTDPSFRHRLLLARDILTKFLAYYRAPGLIRCSLAQAGNIVLRENAPCFNFRLLPLSPEQEADDARVFRLLGLLLQQLFTPYQLRRSQQLRIVFEKCDRNVYHSVGEMLRDLQSADDAPGEEKTFAAAIAARGARLRRLLPRLTALGCLLAVLFLAAHFLGNTSPEEPPAEEKTAQIGTLSVAETPQEPAERPIIEVGALPEPQDAPDAESDAPPSLLQSETTYQIVLGDTLREIAVAQYGSAAYVDALAAFNGLRNKDLILTGASLRLPPKEALDPQP